MNKKIRSLLSFVVFAGLLLGGCAKAAAPTPTATPSPTATLTSTPTLAPTPTVVPTATSTPGPPLLSKSPELILAINKPFRPDPLGVPLIYRIPDMDKVLLASELTYFKNFKVDIYYPPDYHFDSRLPIVILSHGVVDNVDLDGASKDVSQHIDWSKLIAASGMIAVSAQSGNSPLANSYHVLEFLAANADLLGVDITRIGFWACSGQGRPTFEALGDEKLPYREAFRAAVFLYLDLTAANPRDWPDKLSLFVVKSGRDAYISGTSIDTFVSKARSLGIPTEYIELQDAPHGFDTAQNTQANKDVIRKAIEFFKSKLLT